MEDRILAVNNEFHTLEELAEGRARELDKLSEQATSSLRSLNQLCRTTVWRRAAWVSVVAIVGLLLFEYTSPWKIGRERVPSPSTFEISVLVFREGLECILVLAAVTASFKRAERQHYRGVAVGVLVAIAATLGTWAIAVSIINDLNRNISALALQAGTGLLAVVVLLIVMNWFFHKTYWTGWISLHNRRKERLLSDSERHSPRRVLYGMAALGFTSFYREGFEVVLFLQSYRLRVGIQAVTYGVVFGSLLTCLVGIFTFVIHRYLPYRKMLVATGGMLALVLLVMVGEQAQEMQLVGWLPKTGIPWLAGRIPGWMTLWLSVSGTVETLGAQVLAAGLVLGSYFVAGRHSSGKEREIR